MCLHRVGILIDLFLELTQDLNISCLGATVGSTERIWHLLSVNQCKREAKLLQLVCLFLIGRLQFTYNTGLGRRLKSDTVHTCLID